MPCRGIIVLLVGNCKQARLSVAPNFDIVCPRAGVSDFLGDPPGTPCCVYSVWPAREQRDFAGNQRLSFSTMPFEMVCPVQFLVKEDTQVFKNTHSLDSSSAPENGGPPSEVAQEKIIRLFH
ncbi:hypothetical protein AVEN_174820-1 [Araneus ventricosus]|uniref:Uncharacterized protein n=1 Tax=Araneus ventricosus TaxID=182803 RepID=A0A4Y2JL36_ARAVE|nr:hypothetical protein AVEN_174820-1 [Araneus ventricosus]